MYFSLELSHESHFQFDVQVHEVFAELCESPQAWSKSIGSSAACVAENIELSARRRLSADRSPLKRKGRENVQNGGDFIRHRTPVIVVRPYVGRREFNLADKATPCVSRG